MPFRGTAATNGAEKVGVATGTVEQRIDVVAAATPVVTSSRELRIIDMGHQDVVITQLAGDLGIEVEVEMQVTKGFFTVDRFILPALGVPVCCDYRKAARTMRVTLTIPVSALDVSVNVELGASGAS